MGIYLLDNCGDSVSESCIGLKVLFGLFIICLLLTAGYIGRVSWRLYRHRKVEANYYEPLLARNHNNSYSENIKEDTLIYNV